VQSGELIDDEQDRSDFVRRLGSLAVETQTAIYAWALVSNHAHLLVCSGRLGLAKFMRRLLTGYAASYNLDCAALLRICLALGFSIAHLISDPAGIP
jgi:putative transposase